MDAQRVDAATVMVWRWEGLFVASMLSIPLLVVTVLRLSGPALLVPAAIMSIVFAIAWFMPAARYAALDYHVDEAGISIRSGVIWRSHLSLPRVRIQHTDVSQGPLERKYGVATLKLYTAGSRYTRIDLPGLAHDDAIALREALVARAGADSGV